MILSISGNTYKETVLVVDELVIVITWDPKLVKYIVNTAIPPLLPNEVVPDILLVQVNAVVDVPVNKLLSSPFNVTVIVKEK